jgi:predicted membrane protein
VASVADLKTERLAIGDLTVDLGDLDLAGGTHELEASVGIGQLTVVVPDDVTVVLHGDVGLGAIDGLERRDDGWTPTLDQTSEGTGGGRLVLDLEVGIGHVEVQRDV